eukprot:jgi/Chlat1/8833/Chrsp91S08165
MATAGAAQEVVAVGRDAGMDSLDLYTRAVADKEFWNQRRADAVDFKALKHVQHGHLKRLHMLIRDLLLAREWQRAARVLAVLMQITPLRGKKEAHRDAWSFTALRIQFISELLLQCPAAFDSFRAKTFRTHLWMSGREGYWNSQLPEGGKPLWLIEWALQTIWNEDAQSRHEVRLQRAIDAIQEALTESLTRRTYEKSASLITHLAMLSYRSWALAVKEVMDSSGHNEVTPQVQVVSTLPNGSGNRSVSSDSDSEGKQQSLPTPAPYAAEQLDGADLTMKALHVIHEARSEHQEVEGSPIASDQNMGGGSEHQLTQKPARAERDEQRMVDTDAIVEAESQSDDDTDDSDQEDTEGTSGTDCLQSLFMPVLDYDVRTKVKTASMQALRYFDAASKLLPDSTQLAYYHARVNFALGRKRAARKILQEVRKRTQDVDIHRLYVHMPKKQTRSDHQDARARLHSYIKLLAQEPSSQEAILAIMALHNKGVCNSRDLLEQLAMYLDVAPGAEKTWQKLRDVLEELHGTEHSSVEEKEQNTAAVERVWSERRLWWPRKQFDPSRIASPSTDDDRRLLELKARCAEYICPDSAYSDHVRAVLTSAQSQEASTSSQTLEPLRVQQWIWDVPNSVSQPVADTAAPSNRSADAKMVDDREVDLVVVCEELQLGADVAAHGDKNADEEVVDKEGIAEDIREGLQQTCLELQLVADVAVHGNLNAVEDGVDEDACKELQQAFADGDVAWATCDSLSASAHDAGEAQTGEETMLDGNQRDEWLIPSSASLTSSQQDISQLSGSSAHNTSANSSLPKPAAMRLSDMLSEDAPATASPAAPVTTAIEATPTSRAPQPSQAMEQVTDFLLEPGTGHEQRSEQAMKPRKRRKLVHLKAAPGF